MAITSSNMGLRIWNLTTDPYDHAQLADNWAKVDEHDHSAGKGKQIPTGGIADGAITAAKIASGVIPSTFTLDDGSVTTPKLADLAVTTPKLADNSVTSAKIVDGTIATADLANSSVSTGKLQTDAVDATILRDDAVTDANRAVTTDHIRDAAVTANKFADSVAQFTGVTTASGTRRGYNRHDTTDDSVSYPVVTTTSTSFGVLDAHDQINNVVVPSNGGLVFVVYRALWKLAGATGPAKVTLFVGSQQLRSVAHDQVTPVSVAESLSQTGTNWSPLTSTPTGAGGGSGMFGSKPSTSSNSSVDNTLPQAWSSDDTIRWAPAVFEAPGGTYNISIQYKVTDGTLSVKDSRLRIWVVGF